MKKFAFVLPVFFLINSLTGAVSAADVKFAQISDSRFSSENNAELLKNVIEDINRQKSIKFVVFTGDNISSPDKSELEDFLKCAKKLKCPFYIVLGEHDVNKHKNMSKSQYMETVKNNVKKSERKYAAPNYVFQDSEMVFAAVDGSKDVIPGTNGYYKEETLDKVQKILNDYPRKNMVIFQHFPLIPPSDKETYRTYKPERYLEMIEGRPNVKAVISGHFGVNKETEVNGIRHISTAGLPYYRIIDILDCDTSEPEIWTELKNAGQ